MGRVSAVDRARPGPARHSAIARRASTATTAIPPAPKAAPTSEPTPRTTVQSPLRWPGSADWKRDYANAALIGPDELARLRAETDKAKQTAGNLRAARPA